MPTAHATTRAATARSPRPASNPFFADPPDPRTLALRGAHKPLADAPGAIVEKPDLLRTVDDANGGIGSPYRVVDILALLLRAQEIELWHVEAGEHFQLAFGRAHLDPLKAADMKRGGGGALRDLPERVMAAREDVGGAMRALGGMGSPAANVIWDVLGEGLTIKEHAERTIFGSGRSLNPTAAKGILLGALGVLAAHYGYDPQVRVRRMRRAGAVAEAGVPDWL